MNDAQKYKIEEVLSEKGVYMGPTVGVSMLPMLKTRRDTIVIRPKTTRLQRLDVALYKRGDAYVLHRVIQPIDGGYVIRGDNCYTDEYIPENDVFGVLTEFFRKDKHYLCTDKKYLRYAEKRIKTYKFRRFFVLIKLKIKGVIKKFLGILGVKKYRKR